MSTATYTVKVQLHARNYRVHIGEDGARLLGMCLLRLGTRRWLCVCDDNVLESVWPSLARRLAAAGVAVSEPLVVAAGEGSKSAATLSRLYTGLLAAGLDRSSTLVALGGGVVTDVAGFAAATYMRGIDWIAAPTSLLGMVDAAVGGKVGINLQRTKNIVGAFHQPREVICGTDWLTTLPARQRRSGLGEVVKYAMIADRALFRSLERDGERWTAADPGRDAKLVARCCRIKAGFVSADERESGVRAALNFGHTVGHALEGDGRVGLAHGEAVGLGMLVACALAERLDIAREPQQERLRAVLEALKLPVRLRSAPPLAQLRRAWRRDKKSVGGQPRFVLTPRIGEVIVGCEAHEADVNVALRAIASAALA